jgi:mannose-6-phosphate isomerase-like protein (cupin superfamily)
VAKGIGATKWHKHEDQDELFIVYKGRLTIQLRARNIELNEDEMFVVPKGIEHCPIAEHEAEFLIVGLSVTSNAAGGKLNV